MMSMFIIMLLGLLESVYGLKTNKLMTTRIYSERITPSIEYPISFIIILLGSILILFGWMIYKKMVFIIGFIMGMLCSVYLIEVYAPKGIDLPDYMLYGIAIAPLIGGIICGFLSMKVVTLLIVITGLMGGGVVGTYIMTWAGDKVPPAPARTFLLTVCPCIGAILALLYENEVIIVTTSSIGAIFIGVGIDKCLNCTTNFTVGLESALTNVGHVALSLDEITVLVTVLVLTVLGSAIQYHLLRKESSLPSQKN